MTTTSSDSALQPTLSPSLRSELRAVAAGPSLLALDYDGTLAPFRSERSEARMPGELRELLAALAGCEATRVAIVSGRPIAGLEALIDLDPLPELFGVHGWERRLPDGRAIQPAGRVRRSPGGRSPGCQIALGRQPRRPRDGLHVLQIRPTQSKS